jgi:SAM-dependent methyltransferase
MVFNRLLYHIIDKIPLPNFLKRLRGYAYLHFFYYGDLVGYENLIKVCERESIMKLPGDFIEIGSFVGEGTRKLANYAIQFGKKVYAIDIFDPLADFTTCEKGISMANIYTRILSNIGLTMFEAYWFNISKYPNVITIPKDSKKVKFPVDQQFAFGFIDGNHSPEYVVNDFYLVWNHLVPGGIVAFHDYGYDLPKVTETIDKLIQKHRKDVEKIIINPVVHAIFIKKKKSCKTS